MRYFVGLLSLMVVLLTMADCLSSAGAADKKQSAMRAYADGPLVLGDFAGKPPERPPVSMGIDMIANTECQVRYEYRSSLEQKQDSWRATMTSFNCTAVVVPEKCWTTSPQSGRILDHEQGHFDLAEIAARRAREHFAGLMRDGKTTVTGPDKRSVQRALDRDIKKAMDEVYQSLAELQKTYDEETRHGTALVAQYKHRKWQRAELEKPTATK